MNQLQKLLGLYNDWKNLTLSEGLAIASSDWARVAQCQEAKSRLKQNLVLHADELRGETGRSLSDKPAIRAALNQLIELEGRNASLLSRKQEESRVRQRDLEREQNTLGRVRSTYAPAGRKSWSCYS